MGKYYRVDGFDGLQLYSSGLGIARCILRPMDGWISTLMIWSIFDVTRLLITYYSTLYEVQRLPGRLTRPHLFLIESGTDVL